MLFLVGTIFELSITMKKLKLNISFLVALLCFSYSSNAQLFSEDNKYLSVGYGFGNFSQSLFQDYENNTDYNYSGKGPFFIKYETPVSKKVGFGVNFAYVGASMDWIDPDILVNGTTPYKVELDWSSFSILARFNFHFGNSDKFDPYFGFGMGYRDASWEVSSNDASVDDGVSFENPFKLGFETTIGARFRITDNILGYTEVGFAKAVVQFGITAKL